MDITSVTTYRRARTRDNLVLAPGETFIAGGTWLMSEPQTDTTGFVDLTTMGWNPLELTPDGVRIAATCTIAELVAWAQGTSDVPRPTRWIAATELVPAAANALLASFKIWNTATVGGNISRSYAAAAMVSLCAALDGVALVWLADGGECLVPVTDLITGNGTNSLGRGDVVRAVDLPARTLRSRARLHKIALAEHGRSGAVVTGRVDEDGSAVFVVTAATLTPAVMRFERMPDADALAKTVAAASDYYTDPLGAADWRRGVSVVLAERIRAELSAGDEGIRGGTRA